jgi:maltokinase
VPARSAATPAAAGGLDVAAIADWISGRRWFASKSRAIARLQIEDGAGVSPDLTILLTHARFADEPRDSGDEGGERYQLPLSLLGQDAAGDREIVAAARDRVAVDAVADPERARELLRAIAADREVPTDHGTLRFRHLGEAGSHSLDAVARPMGVEQSNSSIVFGDETVLKVFRRLEPGVSPELEMVRFLTLRGYPNIAPLQGFYEYDAGGEPVTLGVAQRFFAGSRDGWAMTLDELADDAGAVVSRLGQLGRATAELHNALASDGQDPAFAPETAAPDFADRLAARVESEIDSSFARLPADERTAPIAGRGDPLAAALQRRARGVSGGRLIRTHGDYHLGQTLWVGGDLGWVIIDFEGEPARPLADRRRKTSPLRDVAGMLRSFAYAAATAGASAPDATAGFEQRARDAYLEQYLAHVDAALLPDDETATADLLSIYELEKAVYELSYELDNRPDWLPIPVAGVARLLEDS